MTTENFLEWFCEFAVKEQAKERPLIFIYDGRLSHASIKLIEKAMEKNITLLKLSPHVTNKFQPLDAGCFSPLKRDWDKTLNERLNLIGIRNSVCRSTYVDMLGKVCKTNEKAKKTAKIKIFINTQYFDCQSASEVFYFWQVWRKGLSLENVVSGFRNTVIPHDTNTPSYKLFATRTIFLDFTRS